MKVIEFESHFNTALKKNTQKNLNKFPQHYDVNQPSYRIKSKVLMFNGMA